MQRINYQTYEKPSDFYKVIEGVNVIRILTDGFIGRKHGMRTSKGWIPLGECTGTNCEHCKKGNEPKLNYIWIVLDRLKAKVRVMEVSKKLGNEIAMLAKAEGDPTTYDIEIDRKGLDKNSTYALKKLEGKEFNENELKAISLNKQQLSIKYLS